MAANESAQDRTEPATEKRLQESRKKGDVPRSRELNTFSMLIASISAMAILGGSATLSYRELSIQHWTFGRETIFNDTAMVIALMDFGQSAILIITPVLALMFVSIFIGPFFMGGWIFSVSSLKVDMAKLNPLAGIKRMFSLQSFSELCKALLKVILIGGVASFTLYSHIPDFLLLGELPTIDALRGMFAIFFKIAVFMAVVMGVITLLDVPYQFWSHARKLKMTRQEIRDEGKETNGNPEVKQRIRTLQQSVSQRRMLAEVSDADVVIVNPTHYAVAIRYRESQLAPEVVAKGVDFMALRIREIAKSADVQIFSAPPLARSIYTHVDVGDSIPTELYLAVAQILAYVMHARDLNARDARRLLAPSDFQIPAHLSSSEN